VGVTTRERSVMQLESADDIALASRLAEARAEIVAELRKLIVGQD
jgi:hypothetical protein